MPQDGGWRSFVAEDEEQSARRGALEPHRTRQISMAASSHNMEGPPTSEELQSIARELDLDGTPSLETIRDALIKLLINLTSNQFPKRWTLIVLSRNWDRYDFSFVSHLWFNRTLLTRRLNLISSLIHSSTIKAKRYIIA